MWQKQAVASHTEMRLNVMHMATITIMASLFLVDDSTPDARCPRHKAVQKIRRDCPSFRLQRALVFLCTSA